MHKLARLANLAQFAHTWPVCTSNTHACHVHILSVHTWLMNTTSMHAPGMPCPYPTDLTPRPPSLGHVMSTPRPFSLGDTPSMPRLSSLGHIAQSLGHAIGLACEGLPTPQTHLIQIDSSSSRPSQHHMASLRPCQLGQLGDPQAKLVAHHNHAMDILGQHLGLNYAMVPSCNPITSIIINGLLSHFFLRFNV